LPRESDDVPHPVQTASISGVFLLRSDLLTNADFEAGGVPLQEEVGRPGRVKGQVGEGWFDSSTWARVEAVYAMDNDRARSGVSCQRIKLSRRESGRVQFAQNVRLSDGRPCRVSLWLRANRAVTIEFGIRSAQEPFPFLGATTQTIGTKWERVQAEVIAPSEGTYQLMLYVPHAVTL
jgi:hypothetical protein